MLPLAAGALGLVLGALLGDHVFRRLAEQYTRVAPDQAGHVMMMVLGAIVFAMLFDRLVEIPVHRFETRESA